jgi:hypothetical protein
MQHVYKGYKNLCNRVIDPKHTAIQGSSNQNTKLVPISQSASQRFERLSDRIEILILSEMTEFTAEKDSLISTVLCDDIIPLHRLTWQLVFQHKCSKRLRICSSPDSCRDASSKAQRALPPCQFSDQLLLNTNRRSPTDIHIEKLLVFFCCHHEWLVLGFVLLQ